MEVPVNVGGVKAVQVEVSPFGKKIWKAVKAICLWFIRLCAVFVLLDAFRAFMQHKLDDLDWWRWIVLCIAWSFSYSWLRKGLINLIREGMKKE